MTVPRARMSDRLADLLDERLADADAELAARYPGDPGTPQPVHTVYVPADRCTAGTHREWGDAALRLLDAHAPTAAELTAATGVDAGEVLDRVRSTLVRRPVEDLRVDFEDGYGVRTDDEEDAAATAAATAIAAAAQADDGPSWVGLRCKSLEAPTRRRGLRTLELVLAGLLDAGGLPDGFVLTLPKVTSVAQVEAMAEVCSTLEQAYALAPGPAGLRGAGRDVAGGPGRRGHCDGRPDDRRRGRPVHRPALRDLRLQRGSGHLGGLPEPRAPGRRPRQGGDAARRGRHRRAPVGRVDERPARRRHRQVHAAWRLHARLVRRSLERGYSQGWDMHPGHLPTRYLATYVFFREALPAAAARLRGSLDRVEGGVMDEPATAQALATTVLRSVHCGAVDPDEVERLTGVPQARLEALVRRTPA